MTDATVDQVEEEPTPDKPGKALRRRIADSWNSLTPAGKAAVLGGAAVATLKVLAALSDARTTPASNDTTTPVKPDTEGFWTNHAGGYYVCSHQGCTKKKKPSITSHACCGRCRTSWLRDCLTVAQRDYDGPGNFFHTFFETLVNPGVCSVCGEGPDAH